MRESAFKNRLMLLIKVSRPMWWVVLPVSYTVGLAFGRHGLKSADFHFSFFMALQLFFLSFPLCLFTFGLNDIYDYRADMKNPRKMGKSLKSALNFDGTVSDEKDQDFLKKAAWFCGTLFFLISLSGMNIFNIFYAFSLLLLSFTYSMPPWRLKTRPPLDSILGGIITVIAPFGMAFSLVDDPFRIPLQIYLFSICGMGVHAFSTTMDYESDKRLRERTFAVVFGMRWAAFFPAAAFLMTFFSLHGLRYKIYFALCICIFTWFIFRPSEKQARNALLMMLAGAVVVSIYGVYEMFAM